MLGFERLDGAGHEACFPATIAHCMCEKLQARLEGHETFSACTDKLIRHSKHMLIVRIRKAILRPLQ